MKNLMKRVILRLMKAMAKRRLKKFKGKIIGVAGSVGKSSAKEAIFTVLNTRFKVKKTKKNMNTDFGLLLTILDIESGFSSATKWSWFLLKGFWHSFSRDHSEVLLLEFGSDKPGDMDFLTSVVKPDIAVITGISMVHMDKEQFSSLEEIFEEKIKLVKAMKDHGVAVLNVDNEYLENFAKKRGQKGRVTYGKDREADFWASQIKQSMAGLDFVLHHDNKRHEVKSGVIGEYQVSALLPAVICGCLMGMSVEDCVAALGKYVLPPGRMSVIPALNDAVILDSSYNSSPEAMKEALKTLASVGTRCCSAAVAGESRRVAVIGTMNELGASSGAMHKMIGEMVPSCADMLITVGGGAEIVAEAAKEKGMDEAAVFSFKNAGDAADFFKKKMKKGDLILVKGSQNNVRLENFVKALMARPEEAKELLVRQDMVWLAKL